VAILYIFLEYDIDYGHFLFFKGLFKKGIEMKKVLVCLFLLPLIIFTSCGCAPLLIGAAIGGVGVYAVSKDTVQADTDKAYDCLWEAALTVSRIRGEITYEDYGQGSIKLKSGFSRICIRVIRLTRSMNRLKVSARTSGFPSRNLAQDILTKILEQAG